MPPAASAAAQWRAPALMIVLGLGVLIAGNMLRHRPRHPEKPVVGRPTVVVTVPDAISSWPQFYDAYGPLPCTVWKSTLRAALVGETLPFPPRHQVKLVFDESAAPHDKQLSDTANKRVEDMLGQTGSCLSEGGSP